MHTIRRQGKHRPAWRRFLAVVALLAGLSTLSGAPAQAAIIINGNNGNYSTSAGTDGQGNTTFTLTLKNKYWRSAELRVDDKLAGWRLYEMRGRQHNTPVDMGVVWIPGGRPEDPSTITEGPIQ